jgi:phage shock protein A
MDDSTAELTREMNKVNKALAEVIAREKEREREREREKVAVRK